MSLPDEIRKFRIGHVGSFLRPPRLLQARKDFKIGTINAQELRRIEDSAIEELVASQREAGLRVVTDGEQRREFFHFDFLEQLDGISVTTYPSMSGDGFVPPVVSVTGKIKHTRPIQLDDFLFLKKNAHGLVPKVAIPSPATVHYRTGRALISQEAYPDLADFFDDLVTAYRAEIKSLYDAGCRYIQLDETNFGYLCDPDKRAELEERGEDLANLPSRYASLINACISDRPEDLIIGLHTCKGNFHSTFFAKGGYEVVAKILFSEILVDVLYLEWDDSRSGDFSPLRFLSNNPNVKRVVVLGLISSKFPQLEKKEEIIQKIKEAASYAPRGLDQLALSTQCGFASSAHGNNISEEDQWAKLKLIRSIVNEVWPESLQ